MSAHENCGSFLYCIEKNFYSLCTTDNQIAFCLKKFNLYTKGYVVHITFSMTIVHIYFQILGYSYELTAAPYLNIDLSVLISYCLYLIEYTGFIRNIMQMLSFMQIELGIL